MNKSTQSSIDYCTNHHSVKGIIADLKMMVEDSHLKFTILRDIIQKVAIRLVDEEQICKKESIENSILMKIMRLEEGKENE